MLCLTSSASHLRSRPQSIEPLERRVILDAGMLDTAFADDGILTIPVAGEAPLFTDIAVMPDGRFVATGATAADELLVARFRPDGTPDITFGQGGFVVSDVDGEALTVAIDEQLRPLVGGSRDNDFFVLRYRTDGKHDKSFGRGGLVSLTFEANPAVARDIAIREDGRIVVAGEARLADGTRAVGLAQFNDDGLLDQSFGTSRGITVTKFADPIFASTSFDVTEMELTDNGAILVAGRRVRQVNPPFSDTAAVMVGRFSSEGRVDFAFGDGTGLALRDVNAREGIATGLAVDSAGRPIVSIGNAGVFAAARFTEQGRRDESFGRAGLAQVSFGRQDNTSDALMRDDASILIAGQIEGRPRIVMLDSAGALDPEFGAGGISATALVRGSRFEEMALAPDGTLLVGGEGVPVGASETELAVVKYLLDDSPLATVISAPDLRAPRDVSYVFVVDWRAPSGLDLETLDSSDLRITGPGGFVRTATLVNTDELAGVGVVRATYKLVPPTGVWDAADNGTYTIELLENAVADIDGNFASPRPLRSFRVDIA